MLVDVLSAGFLTGNLKPQTYVILPGLHYLFNGLLMKLLRWMNTYKIMVPVDSSTCMNSFTKENVISFLEMHTRVHELYPES